MFPQVFTLHRAKVAVEMGQQDAVKALVDANVEPWYILVHLIWDALRHFFNPFLHLCKSSIALKHALENASSKDLDKSGKHGTTPLLLICKGWEGKSCRFPVWGMGGKQPIFFGSNKMQSVCSIRHGCYCSLWITWTVGHGRCMLHFMFAWNRARLVVACHIGCDF